MEEEGILIKLDMGMLIMRITKYILSTLKDI